MSTKLEESYHQIGKPTPNKRHDKDLNVIGNARPFLKKWLHDNGCFSELANKSRPPEDFVFCWIYGGDLKDQHSVSSCYNKFSTDAMLNRMTNIKSIEDEKEKQYYLRRKRNFAYYKEIIQAINDKSFFKLDFDEVGIYKRMMSGGDVFESAATYQLDI